LSGKKCCDHLYFFKGKARCLLIFVELKGEDLADAEEQLSNAIDAICNLAGQGRAWRKHARAVIISPTVSPRDWSRVQVKMKKRGIEVYFGTSKKDHPCNLKKVDGLIDS
jgi:hypothetical protein